jgi:hypothetical protein
MRLNILFISGLLVILLMMSGCKSSGTDNFRMPEKNESHLLELASKEGNVSACAPLTDVINLKRGCYYSLIIYYNNSPICKGIWESNERDYCYQAEARFSGKLEPCYKIANQSIRDWCQWDMVRLLPSCDDVATLPYKDLCLNYMAEKFVNVEFCNSMQDQERLTECYNLVATISNTTNVCDLLYIKTKVRDSYDSCITRIASVNNNPNFCSLVSPEKHNICVKTAEMRV